jgi:hypothetical protein
MNDSANNSGRGMDLEPVCVCVLAIEMNASENANPQDPRAVVGLRSVISGHEIFVRLGFPGSSPRIHSVMN